MCGSESHNRDGDGCAVHVDGRTKRNGNGVSVFVQSHFLTYFHINRNVGSGTSCEECCDRTSLQTFEDQRIWVLADTPVYEDWVCHKVDKQHGTNQNGKEFSVFCEDIQSVGGNSVEHKTKDTKRCKVDDPCNNLGNSRRNILQHFFCCIAGCTESNTKEYCP